MNEDDDLERRLRGALGRPRPGDAVDPDDFLGRVHHGAKVRRVKRGVAVAAVGVLALTGGGLAIDAGGLLGGSKAPVAAGGRTPTTELATDQPTPTDASSSASTPPSRSQKSSSASAISVQISPKSFIAAKDVQPVSLTATGRDHQWVLARTPGDDCGRKECATVFATDQHGADGTWTDLGQLPAPPAGPDTATADSVSQLRFTKRADGTYDGWAFGDALWSTHDSGHTWSTNGAPAGQVTQLEAWGTAVYAGVSSAVPGDDTATLYRSATSADDWQPVEVTPKGLSSVQALAAAKGLVAIINSGQLRPMVYLSTDGDTWQRESPCPRGTDASALSSASDDTGTIGSLWVTCQGLSQSVIRFTDTTDLGRWSSVPNDSFPPAVAVAAQSPMLAYVVGDGLPGIQRVSIKEPARTVPAVGVGPPVLFGFTNPSYGYLLDSYGTILSTTDAGATWSPYAVSDTLP